MATANDIEDTYEARIGILISDVQSVRAEDQDSRKYRVVRTAELKDFVRVTEAYAAILMLTRLPERARRTQTSIAQVLQLAADAHHELECLKDWREKLALPVAAKGLLHIRHHFGYPPVSLYDKGEDVRELDRVCRASGIVLTPSRLRAALKDALRDLNPALALDLYRPVQLLRFSAPPED